MIMIHFLTALNMYNEVDFANSSGPDAVHDRKLEYASTAYNYARQCTNKYPVQISKL